MSFTTGFCKVAKKKEPTIPGLSDTANKNALINTGVDFIAPGLGTAAHSALSERPKGHNRVEEFVGRSVGAAGGGLLGLAAAEATGNGFMSLPKKMLSLKDQSKNVGRMGRALLAVGGLTAGGTLGGAYLANKMIFKKYYDKDGELLPKYKKQVPSELASKLNF
jgi:hypothetical protein